MNTVIGTWGHDRCERPYDDNIGLKSLEESFAEAIGLEDRQPDTVWEFLTVYI
jgi:hypothetical protein